MSVCEHGAWEAPESSNFAVSAPRGGVLTLSSALGSQVQGCRERADLFCTEVKATRPQLGLWDVTFKEEEARESEVQREAAALFKAQREGLQGAPSRSFLQD